MMEIPTPLEIMALMATDPDKAADVLELMGNEFLRVAAKLHKGDIDGATRRLTGIEQGGLSDRVVARVVGPDGKVKQETDTHKTESEV